MTEMLLQLFRQPMNSVSSEEQKELFLAFRELVYRDIFFLLQDHAHTEDIIQEAFMKSTAGGPKTSESSRMKAWLKQVARNTAYDFLRKSKKYRQHIDFESVIDREGDYLRAEEDILAEEVENKLRSETLQHALAELKPDYRVVLLLHYIMEKSYAEICQELHITEQVLTQRLARARKKLAQLFKGKWGDRHE